MTQEEFLEQQIYKGLTNKNEDKKITDLYFSEEEFASVLIKAEHFGISIYDIKTTLNGEAYKTVEHKRKKATDAKWYNQEFKNLKRKQEGLLYSATYKVSKKLLSRDLSNYKPDTKE